MAEVKPVKVFRETGYLINVKKLSQEEIDQAHDLFTHTFYDEKGCSKCELVEERHTETCDQCPNFQGRRQLSKIVERDGSKLLSLPHGATRKVRAFLRSLDRPFEVIKVYPEPHPFRRRIKMRYGEVLQEGMEPFQLKPFQQEAMDVCLKETKGVVQAPPRSGKTILGAAIICAIGCKALIIASQREWLENFKETFIGSDTSPAFTNAKPTQIGFCKTFEDFEKMDVCLATPQQFMSEKGKKLLAQIKDLFTVLCLDEAHGLPALETSRVFAQFNCEYRFGLSATPARKQEGLIEILFELIGPVIYKADVEQWVPTVEIAETGLKFEMPKNGDFTRFTNRIEYSKARIKFIARKAYEAAQQGHMVLVPLLRTRSVEAVVREVNLLSDDQRIAACFTGSVPKTIRKQLIDDARNYKIKVLVGIVKLISVGLNIPRASYLIESAPSSNLPNCEQRTARILTPSDSKPKPVILYILDDCDAMRAMRRNEWWGCVYRKFNPRMTSTTRANLTAWFASSGKRKTDAALEL